MSDLRAPLDGPDGDADPERLSPALAAPGTESASIPEGKLTNADEHLRLGARGPLKTLLVLSSGPLVSQIVSAMYGIVTSMWMARAMGDLGIAATAVFTNLDNCGRAFGFFMNCAASSKISALLGEDRGAEAGQLLCDLMRFCFICGAVCPAIFIPASRPLAKWFGADPEVTHYGFLFLAPLLGCSTITCFYLLLCGALQAEGRSLLVGGVQIASLAANMALFNPLFLLVFKWKTIGAAFGTILSEFIPSVIFIVLYFRGKFGVKPDWHGLLKRFSPHTMPAIRVGVSQLVMNLARSVPSIFLRKYMGLCAEHNPEATFDDAFAGYNGVIRIWGITDGFRLAISMGLLPAISYANAAHRVERVFHLIWHACWVNAVFGGLSCLVTAFWAKHLAMMISRSAAYLRWAVPMLQTSNWEAPYGWIRNVIQTVLQALQYGTTATLYSFGATFVVYLITASVLYATNKADFVRLMLTMPISTAIAVLIGFFMMFFPLRKLWVERKMATAVAADGVELSEMEKPIVRSMDEPENV